MRHAIKGKVAVLLDGGFVRKMLKEKLGKRPEAADVCSVVERLLATPLLSEADLLRVFYYDAPPLLSVEKNPISGTKTDFGETEQAKHGSRLIGALELCEPYAVRRGEVRMEGWRLTLHAMKDLIKKPRPLADGDIQPVITQKGVDIRIGLDIAWISSKRLVDGIVVVTSDSDFVPALKFARREGISVVLATLGRKPHSTLRAHADYVIGSIP